MKKIILCLITLLFVLTACKSKENVVVYADYLSDEYTIDTTDMKNMEIISLSNEYDLFIRNNSESSSFVVFFADTKVKDFEYFTIAIPYGDKIEYTYEKPVLHYDDLSANKSLIIQMDMPETIPFYGISYKDENGDVVRFAIHVSGYDGSIVLENF